MGIYLSSPKTDKTTEDDENAELRFGLSAMQGWRESMEDAVRTFCVQSPRFARRTDLKFCLTSILDLLMI